MASVTMLAYKEMLINDKQYHFSVFRANDYIFLEFEAVYENPNKRITNKYDNFYDVIDHHGKGDGCEICKPVVASIFSSIYNDTANKHVTTQDTNDRFLANIQRNGTYSVVPRVAGGEITAEKLIVIGEVAKQFDLYTKITGAQRAVAGRAAKL